MHQIDDFSPRKGYPGTILEIQGKNFATDRKDNIVTVGNSPALVLQSSDTKLKIMTDLTTNSGPVKVSIGGHTVIGPYDFKILTYPQPTEEVDGPPILFAGRGDILSGDVPSTGTLNVLVVLVNPTDRVPANATASRDNIVQVCNNVHTFYDQASYSRLNVHLDITANWHTLTGNFNDYVTVDPADLEAPTSDLVFLVD